MAHLRPFAREIPPNETPHAEDLHRCNPALLALGTTPTSAQTPLTTELVADGFFSPTWVGSPPGDERIFVLEQNSGRIWIIDGERRETLPTPFLDVGAIAGQAGERGLLGLAFHPDFENNDRFFIVYT